MSHAAVTTKDGTTECITEFNGGFKFDLTQGTTLTLETFVLNKNMSVFFSMIPKLYYIVPYRLRLIPDLRSDEQVIEEMEDLDDDEKREIQQADS